MRIAIIGGSGLDQYDDLHVDRSDTVQTDYGDPSGPLIYGSLSGVDVVFLPRHGPEHHLPPHRINYRANISALANTEVDAVIAITAVGGIGRDCGPGQIVIPHDIIDYTWGREHTVDEGADGQLAHIDFTEPYDRDLRLALIQQAEAAGIAHEPSAVYGATQGPRLETAAEIRRMARDGCDVVGMTGMPEAALAAELGMDYASICLVVNPAAGLSDMPITLEAMQEILDRETAVIGELLDRWLQSR